MRIGVALLPTHSDIDRIVDFAYRAGSYMSQAPTLDREHHLPHLDLINTYIGPGDEHHDILQLVLDDYLTRGRLLSHQYTARLTHIDCHPDRLIFAYLARLQWLSLIHI